MKPITVKDLAKLCKVEELKGNGDKVIMISDDDEGNGYHYLWYSFQTAEEYDKGIKDVGLGDSYLFNYNDNEISKKKIQ